MNRPARPAFPAALAAAILGLSGPAIAQPPARDAAIPGLENTDLKVGRAPLRAEGTFLVRQRGTLMRLPGGERIFVFHRDAEGRAERPMVLIPSQTLERLEQLTSERPDTAFSITGQVFAYHSLNYLLPTAYTIVQPTEPGAETPAAPQPAPAPTGETPAAPAKDDPGVDEIIAELERQRERPRTLEGGPSRPPPTAAPAPSPTGGAGATTLIPEGRTVTKRKGRLVRAGTGEWLFVVDSGISGAAGSGTEEPAMVVTPGLNLQRMEAWAMQQGDAVQFEVTGRILAHGGRNYLVPQVYRVVTPTDLEPRP